MSITIKDIIKLKKDIYKKLDDDNTNVKEQVEEVFDTFIENMDSLCVNLPVTPNYPLRTTVPWTTPMSPTCTTLTIEDKLDIYRLNTPTMPWNQVTQAFTNSTLCTGYETNNG